MVSTKPVGWEINMEEFTPALHERALAENTIYDWAVHQNAEAVFFPAQGSDETPVISVAGVSVGVQVTRDAELMVSIDTETGDVDPKLLRKVYRDHGGTVPLRLKIDGHEVEDVSFEYPTVM